MPREVTCITAPQQLRRPTTSPCSWTFQIQMTVATSYRRPPESIEIGEPLNDRLPLPLPLRAATASSSTSAATTTTSTTAVPAPAPATPRAAGVARRSPWFTHSGRPRALAEPGRMRLRARRRRRRLHQSGHGCTQRRMGWMNAIRRPPPPPGSAPFASTETAAAPTSARCAGWRRARRRGAWRNARYLHWTPHRRNSRLKRGANSHWNHPCGSTSRSRPAPR